MDFPSYSKSYWRRKRNHGIPGYSTLLSDKALYISVKWGNQSFDQWGVGVMNSWRWDQQIEPYPFRQKSQLEKDITWTIPHSQARLSDCISLVTRCRWNAYCNCNTICVYIYTYVYYCYIIYIYHTISQLLVLKYQRNPEDGCPFLVLWWSMVVMTSLATGPQRGPRDGVTKWWFKDQDLIAYNSLIYIWMLTDIYQHSFYNLMTEH